MVRNWLLEIYVTEVPSDNISDPLINCNIIITQITNF